MMKPYRVTLRSVVTVDVEIDATTTEEARAKAFAWNTSCVEGSKTIGDYYLDDDLLSDEGEMYWIIQDVETSEIVEVLELEAADRDEDADEAGRE
jgi:hypothetical protein